MQKMNEIRKTLCGGHTAHMTYWCPLALVPYKCRQSLFCSVRALPLNNTYPKISVFPPFLRGLSANNEQNSKIVGPLAHCTHNILCKVLVTRSLHFAVPVDRPPTPCNYTQVLESYPKKIFLVKKNFFRPAGHFKFQIFVREPQSHKFLIYA